MNLKHIMYTRGGRDGLRDVYKVDLCRAGVAETTRLHTRGLSESHLNVDYPVLKTSMIGRGAHQSDTQPRISRGLQSMPTRPRNLATEHLRAEQNYRFTVDGPFKGSCTSLNDIESSVSGWVVGYYQWCVSE